MNKEGIKAKITEAIEITQDVEEPYKSVAFQVILKRLVEEAPSPTAR